MHTGAGGSHRAGHASNRDVGGLRLPAPSASARAATDRNRINEESVRGLRLPAPCASVEVAMGKNSSMEESASRDPPLTSGMSRSSSDFR